MLKLLTFVKNLLYYIQLKDQRGEKRISVFGEKPQRINKVFKIKLKLNPIFEKDY